MSFLFSNTRPSQRPLASNGAPASVEANSADVAMKFYQELIDRRPVLLDEKLKLHARIIDEFNLTLLEKMPREELLKQVRSYVADYVNCREDFSQPKRTDRLHGRNSSMK